MMRTFCPAWIRIAVLGLLCFSFVVYLWPYGTVWAVDRWQEHRQPREYVDVLAHMRPEVNLSSIPFDRILALYEPLRVPIDAQQIVMDGETLSATQPPGWTEHKRICIVDIDNRAFTNYDELFGISPFDWNTITAINAGMLSHYLYALIHGYDYKFIHTQNIDGQWAMWTKPPAISDTLHDYDFVIAIDADAQFKHPHVPFEWLLNRWNVSEHTRFTMALDPPDKPNYDKRGRRVNNAGFVVVQNLERTHEMLRAWSDCVNEPSDAYEGCSQYKVGWPAEQGAFANYVRYEFNLPNDLHEIPCDEANGSEDHRRRPFYFGQFQHSCQGRFVEHHTLTKPFVKRNIAKAHAELLVPQVLDQELSHMGGDVRVRDAVAEVLMRRVYEHFISEKETRVVERTTNEFSRYNAN